MKIFVLSFIVFITLKVSSNNSIKLWGNTFIKNECIRNDESVSDFLEFHYSKIKITDYFCDTITVNVQQIGAKGDGITDDWAVIEKAVVNLDKLGGGILFFPNGTYIVKNAISLKSKIIFRGESKYTTIIKASNESLDNVFGQGYPLYKHWKKSRLVGGTIDRLKKPDFLTNYSEEEAFIIGGMAGYAVTNIKIENLTIDGNKNNRSENKVNLRGLSSSPFLGGEAVVSSSGGRAVVSGFFGGDSGFSIEPRTVEGVFDIGDLVQGEESGATMIVQDKKADDAYQMLIRFDAVSHSFVRNCIIKNSVFTALSIYNYSNNNSIDSNEFFDNNKRGTDFTWGRMNIFVEFDARKNIISNNTVNGGLGYSIFVQSTGGMNYDTHILNNKVFHPGADGIRVGNETSNSSIINSKIIGNTVVGANGEGAVGIRVIHYGEGVVSKAEISNNLVKNCIYGILLQGRVGDSRIFDNFVICSEKVNIASTALLKGNRIFNNSIKEN
jgi:hypothetical protein